MKKKLLALICMITCIFGLTACGNGQTLTTYEQQKVDNAEQLAAQGIVPLFADYLCQGNPFSTDELTMEEISYLCQQYFGIEADGYAVATAIESFSSALETMGGITEIAEAEAVIDDDQIVVEVTVKGENKDASAEVIFSNDMFLTLESASLNLESSTGELMSRAALNTLIGMGTVFIVLILISLLISCLKVIPKLQEASAKRREAKKAGGDAGDNTGIDNGVAQIAAREEVADVSDDLELVAVIAAAIAANEGAASADGFVVRSIIRRA